MRAQQGGLLRGQVVEEGQGITDVHVLNLSAQTATITNPTGYFFLAAQAGDTLLFSAVRYRRTSLVVSQAMLEAPEITVPLEPFVNELDEVVVTPYHLTGDLTRDLERLPEKEVVNAWTLGLPNANARKFTPTENRLNEATTGAGIVPLNPILNAITGRTKQLKKQLAYERRYAKAEQLRVQFTDSVLIRELGIPAGRIPDFLYFCEVDSLFEPVADSGDRLRLWAFLRRKSNEYRGYNSVAD
ncbi:carboxypeptidase-like regulatory domain-containing protein [Robiginitalea sp. M366]|uniref:carboxypeptidase-like regulatory domain-containing protein n=1 Tax=Robiginitalea aestuariiviva TaxID=3036903 RepID=UPI00240DAFF2|nr:carboxypeptidase-like regulatory domain-containing protein [Robiginitalea aestuariiviva]MDG1570786.1 carboxypeptidase-like regulatory domain-containing protein [Robiginitalea aestuariiviva]